MMKEKPKLLDQVRQVLLVKSYSYHTWQAYVAWIKRYILYHDERHPAEMRDALRRHNTIIREAVVSNNGQVFKTIGDEFCTVFSDPCNGLSAALFAQRGLVSEPWPSYLPDWLIIPFPFGDTSHYPLVKNLV
jgi:hypothetical protein